MSRTLLTSEIAILIEAGATSPREVLAAQTVWGEHHVPPHQLGRKQWFNTDFVLELAERDSSEKPRVAAVQVRPYTLGGDFFVWLAADGTPIFMELLEGECLPKTSFKEEVQRIDAAIESLPSLPQRLTTRRAPYLRVVRLSESIAFLLCSTTTISEVLSAKPMFAPSADGTIEVRSAGSHVLIDGCLTAKRYESPWQTGE